MYRAIIFAAVCGLVVGQDCTPSATTASGSFAPQGTICSGQIIFQEEFDSLNFQKWEHENTLGGGGNWEFQWYNNNRTNSFVYDGVLHIKPTLTADHLGYNNIFTDTLDINGGAPADECTNPLWYGCIRTGTSNNVLNPIKSARLRTLRSFSFKYGRVVARARMPAGDWLWPAIWMMPRYNAYGGWPTSGEIDIVESRGNRNLMLNGQQIGTQLMGSTLHWGPDWAHNGYPHTHWEKRNAAGFDTAFHTYEVVWTPTNINFYVDGEHVGGVTPPAGGLWELGGWGNSLFNPWQSEGLMAPFDQEFYIIVNNAVGGTAYFPDEAVNANGKPWHNASPQAATDFWNNRNMWLNTWNLANSNDAALQVDYIRVYAL
ncbi:Glycosyl hydrolases family 16 [Popillia japonica]|uniref:Glycosyl hydrolases family 16 n=1 Tax=Popillia japonica TaxID=7064 RepID=A0AAW1LR41_POPJA